jgi:diaminohydroxyphosphoribosylaminopyrimidine deaminase/5-amino-6-(5-phosphoribosylamino)uracil reductase
MQQTDHNAMVRALEAAREARLVAPPNPWVGCVVACLDGREFVGSTQAPGSRHAERVALDAAAAARADVRGATAYVTLEPCSHHGRTPPCADALIDAGVARVVIALRDPDQRVSGQGIERLRDAGISVEVGLGADEGARLLEPYLHHRRTGRPYVVVKLAATLDGRTAAPDGTSRWITSADARLRVHQLRAESGAVIVGASTVRADDPELTVRHVTGPSPRRVVLGRAPAGAKVHPCTEWQGDLGALLDQLGQDGILQVLVEGGAKVAASFHRARLVDRYVIHLAPALMGGDDGMSMLSGLGASTIAELWRGRIDVLRRLGDDIEIELIPQETP